MMATAFEQIEQELEEFEGLVRHPGWERLAARIRAQADNQMTKMRNAASQEELLKATYTYLALHDLPEAPTLLIRTLREQLKRTPK